VKRILLMLTVALMLVAMLAVMAAPAFAVSREGQVNSCRGEVWPEHWADTEVDVPTCLRER
jgi:hypothetical protein